MTTQVDTVVLGGGIAGLCVARRLAQAGDRVVLVEKRQIGAGASGAAAGLQEVAWNPKSDFQRRMAASYAGYPAFVAELVEETGREVELSRTGSLHVAADVDAESRLKKRFERLHQDGAPVRWLEPDAIESLLGQGAGDIRSGLLNEEARRVHPPDLLRALRQSLVSHDVEILEDVHDIRILDGQETPRVNLVPNEREPREICSTRVVVCAGAWTTELLAAAGIEPEAEVVPIRGQMVQIDASDLPTFECVLHLDDHYVIPRPGRSLLVGATVEDVGFDERVTADGIEELLSVARKFFPQINCEAVQCAQFGLRPKLLRRGGALVTCGRISVLAGHYRNGILAAPRDADHLVKGLTGTSASHYW